MSSHVSRFSRSRTMQVREAVAEDAPGIGNVDASSHAAAYSGLMPADYLARNTPEAGAERWRRILTGTANPPPGVTLPAKVYVAVEGDEVLGYTGFGPSGDEDGEAVGQLGAIYVSPEHWRQGIGHELMAAAIAWFKSQGFREATLWVLEQNRQAGSFYEKEGWFLDGARKSAERGGWTMSDVRYRRRVA